MKRGARMPRRTAYRSVARGVPPSPRKGLNSKKDEAARRRQRREKRAGAWKRIFRAVRTLVISAFLIAALGAGGWAAYQAYERNGFLALKEVVVSGNKVWDKNALLEKAGVELGMKLPMVPVGTVEAALRGLPGVAGVRVKRVFPSRLEIEVSEQEPVAMGFAKGWRGLAPDGSALPGLDLRESDLPVIDGFAAMNAETRAHVGAFLDGVKREYPELYAGFSQLSAKGADEIDVVLRDGAAGNGASLKVILDMSNKSLNSLEFLQALMRQQGNAIEAGKTLDMRVEGYAYVR